MHHQLVIPSRRAASLSTLEPDRPAGTPMLRGDGQPITVRVPALDNY